uniref:Uncharacterized protein n=1 Tax=Anguilla anguilla TaxID=7936 RepID=A0A0E9WYA4_ANGAN
MTLCNMLYSHILNSLLIFKFIYCCSFLYLALVPYLLTTWPHYILMYQRPLWPCPRNGIIPGVNLSLAWYVYICTCAHSQCPIRQCELLPGDHHIGSGSGPAQL